MALRWCAAGMVEAGKQFRRVNGHPHLRSLRDTLERVTQPVGATRHDGKGPGRLKITGAAAEIPRTSEHPLIKSARPLKVAVGAQSRGVMGLEWGRDFFISYTAVNRAVGGVDRGRSWSGPATPRCCRPGTSGRAVDFVHQMQQATSSAARTIAVLSPAYFGSRFGEAEWRAAFAKDPSGERGLLVPVRVQPCEPPGLLASRVYIDLVDVDETTARQRLLAGVKPGERPDTAPFPGAPRTGRPRPAVLPGAGAVSWAGPGGEQSAAAQPQLLRPRGAAAAVARRPAGRRGRCGVAGRGGARAGWGRQDPAGAGVRPPVPQRLRRDLVGAGRATRPPPPRRWPALAGQLGVPGAADQRPRS